MVTMATARPCVLVVDDEKDVRALLETMLSDAGFAVASAGDGAVALEIIERQAVDLAVVDLRLPGTLDGLETVRRARASHPDLKVLFISGVEPPPRGGDCDRDNFVSKPFFGREFLGCVFELLLRNTNPRSALN
jgi:two-component system, OmpR family, response regulator